jgi:hypothetical protein
LVYYSERTLVREGLLVPFFRQLFSQKRKINRKTNVLTL